jgi:hypothetical protein
MKLCNIFHYITLFKINCINIIIQRDNRLHFFKATFIITACVKIFNTINLKISFTSIILLVNIIKNFETIGIK